MSRGAAASTAPSPAASAPVTSTQVGAAPRRMRCSRAAGCRGAGMISPGEPAPDGPAPAAVGSKEGWQPTAFRSSRDARAAVQQSVEQYLDEDELEELRRTNLQVGLQGCGCPARHSAG